MNLEEILWRDFLKDYPKRGGGNLGKLVFICGPMMAGKTTRLIAEGERYAKAGKSILYLKPAIDNRYSADEIVTHTGMKVPASIIPCSLKDRYIVERAEVLLIDEVQFIDPHLIREIVELANEGKTVIGAGLDLDYRTEPFRITKELLAHADEVIKIKGICRCGNETRYSLLKQKQNVNGIVHLGASETYEAVCRICYEKRKECEK